MIREESTWPCIQADSWEEVVSYVATIGKMWGWELLPPPEPFAPGEIERYREEGIPDEELPPKYMELWAKRTRSRNRDGRPYWQSSEPRRVGSAGVAYVLNGNASDEECRRLYLITYEQE